MRKALITIVFLTQTILPASAQDTVFLIRHGEKEATGSDPALTQAGRQRAARWAEMLRSAPIDAVITSDAARTRETGAIIADALALPASDWPMGDTAGLVDLLQFDHEDGTVLVIGHTETIPHIVERLGGPGDATISPDSFDTLFVLQGANTGAPRQLRLHMP